MRRPLHWTTVLVHSALREHHLRSKQQVGPPVRPLSPPQVSRARPKTDGPATTGARLQAPTRPHTPVALAAGLQHPPGRCRTPTLRQQSFGPGIATKKNPHPSRPHSLRLRSGTPGSALLGRRDPATHEAAAKPQRPRGARPLIGSKFQA
ncbi:hypothetical protein NDU88_003009 [Pleurodeles waltl]|uniref:Uncharacterized protein n=1 Tax=Pleurodeles waltl TaxID=8319 RepID=A0AAV7MT18_PLEWA|nr:hypothetical protein NDU88_003009 [Pleurodeles waltl]